MIVKSLFASFCLLGFSSVILAGGKLAPPPPNPQSVESTDSQVIFANGDYDLDPSKPQYALTRGNIYKIKYDEYKLDMKLYVRNFFKGADASAEPFNSTHVYFLKGNAKAVKTSRCGGFEELIFDRDVGIRVVRTAEERLRERATEKWHMCIKKSLRGTLTDIEFLVDETGEPNEIGPAKYWVGANANLNPPD